MHHASPVGIHGKGRAIRRIAAASLLVLTLGLTACTDTVASGVRVTDAWVRLLPGALPAAGYFVLHNNTDRTIVLIGASAQDFASASLHKSVDLNGMSTMVPFAKVTVPAHGEIRFQPGGYHLMLTQPREPLSVGGTEPITLQLQGGTLVTVAFELRGPDGTAGK